MNLRLERIMMITMTFFNSHRVTTDPSPPCSAGSPQESDGQHWSHHIHSMGLSSDIPSNGKHFNYSTLTHVIHATHVYVIKMEFAYVNTTQYSEVFPGVKDAIFN